jgi:hypothetical protein
LVDIGGDTPAWPAPSSLLAMAWAHPGFVPRRVLPALPADDAEAIVVIAADSTVVVTGEAVLDPEQQPFGVRGARRVTVDGRQMVLPNVEHRALILDLTGSSPFAVPAPLTADPELARRIDLGYRYIANGRLRLGLELLTPGSDGDPLATSLVEMVARRLAGDVGIDDDGTFTSLALSIGGGHHMRERWAVAPNTAVTVASARTA